MLNLLITHAALGAILGVGSRATVLFLPSVAALLEGFLVASVCGYSILTGCVLSFTLLAALQASYVVASLAEEMRAQSLAA